MLTRRPPLTRSHQDLGSHGAGYSGDYSGAYSANGASRTAPEINLIPFIDVLLVILIFLMISTTFTKYQELSITLPSAEGVSSAVSPQEISVAVNHDGRYAINGLLIDGKNLSLKLGELSKSWKRSESSDELKEGRIIISADARAPHQSVMRVLEAAREAGLSNVSFATQSKSKANR
jgi:biopolymer transport protein ExbD